jgi:hypothetical protein
VVAGDIDVGNLTFYGPGIMVNIALKLRVPTFCRPGLIVNFALMLQLLTAYGPDIMVNIASMLRICLSVVLAKRSRCHWCLELQLYDNRSYHESFAFLRVLMVNFVRCNKNQ